MSAFGTKQAFRDLLKLKIYFYDKFWALPSRGPLGWGGFSTGEIHRLTTLEKT